jgi:hypothetical protein
VFSLTKSREKTFLRMRRGRCWGKPGTGEE